MSTGNDYNKLDVWLESEGERMAEHDNDPVPAIVNGVPTMSCFVEVEEGKKFSINVKVGGQKPYRNDFIAEVVIDGDRIHALYFKKRNHKTQFMDTFYHNNGGTLEQSCMAFGRVVERIDFPPNANAVDDGTGSIVVSIRRGVINNTSVKTHRIVTLANNIGRGGVPRESGIGIVPVETTRCEEVARFNQEFVAIHEDKRSPWITFVFKYRSHHQLVRDGHLEQVSPQQYPGQGRLNVSIGHVKKRPHTPEPIPGPSRTGLPSRPVTQVKGEPMDDRSLSPAPLRTVHDTADKHGHDTGADLRAFIESQRTFMDSQNRRMVEMEIKMEQMSQAVQRQI